MADTTSDTPGGMLTHFDNIRTSLVGMYRVSKFASHPVVTGTLREAFIRGVLQGHLPENAAWSSGQLVGSAPDSQKSGQLDLIVHSGALPQIHLHDGFWRLVPSDAAIAVVEVKSDLTTSRTSPSGLASALESLVKAKGIDRRGDDASGSPVPFHIIAFTSKIKAKTIGTKTREYLDAKHLEVPDYWPESIVVLSGAVAHPNGFGLFKDHGIVVLPSSAIPVDVGHASWKPKLVNGGTAFAVLVAALANSAVRFDPSSFGLERYVYPTSHGDEPGSPSHSPGDEPASVDHDAFGNEEDDADTSDEGGE